LLSDHPVDVGLRSEAAIMARLVKTGHSLAVPFGVNQRYDLLLDLGDRFLRVQCKTGRLRNGVVEFSTRSVRTNMQGIFGRSYSGEIDAFAVYCPATDGVYVVPIEDATGAGMRLRIEPPLNRQTRRVNWASEYELPA
jgi:hypothetical protein